MAQSSDNSCKCDGEENPAQVKKISQLLQGAVMQNRVSVLRRLLNSPKWYNVTDGNGYSLLQLAILFKNKEAFDYVISMPGFPLEICSKTGLTALIMALTSYTFTSNFTLSWNRKENEYFALELLKKGARFDKTNAEGNTPLHCSLRRSYDSVTKFLIKAGAELHVPNNMGKTPFDMMLSCYGFDELTMTLLEDGIVPTIELFEKSVLAYCPHFLQEILFLYVFDQYYDAEIEFMVLLQLALQKSYLFHELVKYPVTSRATTEQHSYLSLLLSVNTDDLKTLLKNHPSFIKQIFQSYDEHDSFICTISSLENVDVLMNSDIKYDIINFLNSPNSCEIIEPFHKWIDHSESDMSGVYCYLLSYSFRIKDLDLQQVYSQFGYLELFKILLHMDFELTDRNYKNLMPALIYDVNMDLQKSFQNPKGWRGTSELFRYFSDPQLKCFGNKEKIPEVPSLLELARNSFRKFFIETFEIKTSRQFYTLLRCLPIDNVYKKIISYETKIYNM